MSGNENATPDNDLTLPKDKLGPGDLIRWSVKQHIPLADGASTVVRTHHVGYVAANLGWSINCVTADGRAFPNIPPEFVHAR